MASWLEPTTIVSSWTDYGDSVESIIEALTDLYWEGITREIGTVIMCLKHLEGVECLPEEEDIMLRIPTRFEPFITAWGKIS